MKQYRRGCHPTVNTQTGISGNKGEKGEKMLLRHLTGRVLDRVVPLSSMCDRQRRRYGYALISGRYEKVRLLYLDGQTL
jgi:hypothetical protein